ncbi:hypothetical protein B5M09_002267 [Aphanomyces astaci]|uniref:ELMO domain-containing protein n=1 Tax=Aphanomyces astaci TaxID=112090 RepID=A0A425DCN3_APHAT|nr:hypothetical protein B5M09_002267 [Aphanomyces astaci]
MYGNHASNNHAIPFQRKGSGWRDIGFSTDNPADDIRATGELGLECLDSDLSLFRLFAFCFLMFDELFCDHVATTKALPLTMCPPSTVAKLADVGKEKLLATLRRAPAHLTDLTDLCANGQVLRRTNFKVDVDDRKPKPSPWTKSPSKDPQPLMTSSHCSLFDGLVQK